MRGRKGGIRDRGGGRGGTERGWANALGGADERTCDRCGTTVARVVSWWFLRLRRGRSEPGRTTRATVAPHARLRTVGSRTIHGTEVRWRRKWTWTTTTVVRAGLEALYFLFVMETMFTKRFRVFLSLFSHLSRRFRRFFRLHRRRPRQRRSWTRTRRIVDKIWTSPFESTTFKTMVDEN